MSISPQILLEFIHVVTDSRRFQNPLEIGQARDLAEQWWTAAEVDRVIADELAMERFLQWHRDHRLGRKRLIDTLIAATSWSSGVSSILTTNARDFTLFGVFECVTP